MKHRFEMMMQKEKKLVPELRFPGFEGEWDRTPLKKITSYVDYRGRAPKKSDKGHFLVTAKNIKKGFIDYVCSQEYVEEVDYATVMSKGMPMIGDVLFTTEAPMGNVAQVNIDNIALAQRVIKFRGNRNLNNSYLLYYMLSPIFQKTINKKAIGTTVQGISGKELHKIKILYPSILEQQKIASFFTTIYTRIQQLEKKKNLLEQYKKGVMQQIFKQEIRFKDDEGKEFVKWESKKIGRVFNERNEKNFTEMELLSISIDKGIYPQSESNKKDSSNSDKSKYKRVLKNDIAYNSMRMWQGASSVSEYDGIVSPAYTILEGNRDNDSKYFGYLFKMSFMLQQFQKYSQGLTSDTWNLKYPMISKIKIDIPCLEEQTKIAHFLTALDTKIAVTTEQVEQTKKWKKGLLQRMFV